MIARDPCSFVSEEVSQRGAPLFGLESILLVDPNPRQLLPPPRQLVAAPRQLLLRLEQLEPRCQPRFTCPGYVRRHRFVSFVWVSIRFSILSLRTLIAHRETGCGERSRIHSFLDTTWWLLVTR